VVFAEKSHEKNPFDSKNNGIFFPLFFFSLFSSCMCLLCVFLSRVFNSAAKTDITIIINFCRFAAAARRMSRIQYAYILCVSSVLFYCVTEFWWFFILWFISRVFAFPQTRAWWLRPRWCSSIIARPYSFKHISRLYRGWPLSMYYEINRINNFNKKEKFLWTSNAWQRRSYIL